MAKQGAHVVFACRNEENAKKAIQDLQKDVKDAKTTFIKLDLSDLDSVKEFAENFKKTQLPLHWLINNAGMDSHIFTKFIILRYWLY